LAENIKTAEQIKAAVFNFMMKSSQVK